MFLTTVFVIRHAESLEDLDPILHNALDEEISVTENGKSEITKITDTIRSHGVSDRISAYVSCSRRAQETLQLVERNMPEITLLKSLPDSRIRNLDWGNTNSANRVQIERERYHAGVLYYQFPGGDNTPKYVRSIEAFVSECLLEGKDATRPNTAIVVTHGFALRIVVKALTGMNDQEFRWLANPPNCYVATLKRIKPSDRFKLVEPLPRFKGFIIS